jgi:hypothetical protein
VPRNEITGAVSWSLMRLMYTLQAELYTAILGQPPVYGYLDSERQIGQALKAELIHGRAL